MFARLKTAVCGARNVAMFCIAILTTGIAFAQEAPVLTVDDAIAKEPSVSFTHADLDALPQADITTKTPWHDGAPTFSGPSCVLSSTPLAPPAR